MSIQPYFDNLEPDVQDLEIWRYMRLEFFEDLMANDEPYFRRAGLFEQDESEGIPPEDYIRRIMRRRRYDPQNELQLIHQLGVLSQNREMFYVNCWELHEGETRHMWEKFGKLGVAICSRYDLLKSTMDSMLDMAHLGVMRYGRPAL